MTPILLNPGPVTLTERVRRALLKPDICHREPEFAELTLDIKQRLVQLYPQAAADYEAVLLTGSGTCAVEAMVSSLIPHHSKTLVVTNGVYGERIAKMVSIHGKAIEVVASEWHQAMNLEAVSNHLSHDPTITHVVAVHHETTTGRLNDVVTLGRICRDYQVSLLLDCVSSFGAEAISFDDWNLEACAATANKCLHSTPGVSFVLVRRSVFESRPSAAGSLYLDLYRYYQEQLQGYSPFTQAVQSYYALQEALKELEDDGGWQSRHQHYTNLSHSIHLGLQQLGIESFLNQNLSSCVLRSFNLPANLTYEYVHDDLKQAGFVIYAGQSGLKKILFRIANMGDLQTGDVNRLLQSFHQIIHNNNTKVAIT